MIILGVDPGSINTGYGVIKARGKNCELVDLGVIRTGSRKVLSERLKVIYDGLCDVIERTQPEMLAIETAFGGRFPKAALVLGHARGVALLAGSNYGLQVWEYAPREVKMAIVGSGGASKQQVNFMVHAMLNLPRDPIPEDAADATAVALCHNYRISGKVRIDDRIRRR